ncbi:TIGR03086 family metal-binding protein [Nocardioides KLBMP 9356]|uniref:TIGR03086 family metal-binding protein n=1 Tax=Nocardioides potassii TaxID=2911371 RepID=A0ABS9HCJ5_9ACTN|nr:TIGR03086 family metal-binding protein [Nocardioides potassii]MCF6378915.1 TIGR03086 family metal-binding protein [Nocardioides potassii]
MALPESPAERHREVAGALSRLTEQVSDWSAPAPVDGWAARDVVDHLVSWFRGFLSAGGVDLDPGPNPTDDPVAAWRHHAAGVQGLLDHRGEEDFTHPYVGTHPLATAVDRFYTADVFMHSWDLARATGQDPHLDEDEAGRMLEGMRPIEAMLRDSGQYGPAVPVPDDASAVDRLMGFVGRDPSWRPAEADSR